jgi:hypothetical protein
MTSRSRFVPARILLDLVEQTTIAMFRIEKSRVRCGSGNVARLERGCIRTHSVLRKVNEMTETMEVNIAEALALIDEGLGLTMSRELMSTGEVADLLLDVRTILAAVPTEALVAEDVVPEPIA